MAPIRYMGTKRFLTPHVRKAIFEASERGPVVDLFGGMGAASASLRNERPVYINDVLTFTNCFARALFAERTAVHPRELIGPMRCHYEEAVSDLSKMWRTELQREATVLKHPDWTRLREYIGSLPHAGNCIKTKKAALHASGSQGIRKHKLAQLYFAGSYLSLRQAIQVDAIKYAIDTVCGADDIAIAAWLGSVSDCVNSPGHTAQFLQARTQKSAARVSTYWHRSIWDRFLDRIHVFEPIGDAKWRRQNRITNLEACNALRSVPEFTVVYADPPYTKDHYSRYYHLYETLYKYDFPESKGLGRYRTDRFLSDYSTKSAVEKAFIMLIEAIIDRGANLVLSYPTDGLLHKTGISLDDLLQDQFKKVTRRTLPAAHSTMGAKAGPAKKLTLECIYVCSI
ncbi:hypothetical protein A5756_18275 [Mycobacterium sp. 852002-53434_SCH5985345]|uniref:DNA adenine methylase n=1 Tax=Mycobacterium sp. 852002-53434_SCH5985345 TaxID=1834107 RepID=UPI0007FFD2C6|nr:DNA adenine methylase [Mycobacterium sp. 852002-53434_SCH5985345]OBF51776.1 hypothetical protein A5756_18275 [Mycobacterium sp. 852002-53434_SCH5985345]